ncbi:MAG: HPr family phosphocarrier protein [Defluviitaleaceae bacterium]|nr:HPr family phosphocarrier protein [Defluviitaleaceae bacterium]MCL2224937.1 HPr family phosphocarrier protein [Defluviitaleaceae bacterium]MCL2262501.1 HPr family phosphocarrier protein [Defluviitaleaceae bacterium]
MQTVNVVLDTVDKVKGFVNTVAPLEGDIDLGSDRYVVDAKSIMGIFSLDLSKPLQLTIHDEATASRIVPLLKAYIV